MAKSRRSGKKVRRSRRHRGGVYSLASAAPVSDLSPVPTRSDRQGQDFASYHEAQHGGSAPLSQAFTTLDPNLRGSAMLNGIDMAIADSALLHDDTLATQYSEQGAADQSGGKRRRKRRATKRRGQKRRGKKKSQKSRSH